MMTSIIIWTIVVIAALGLVLAVILYLVAEKFKVEEDPRIEQVEKVMPGANCGRLPCLCRGGSESSESGQQLLSGRRQ